MRLLINPVLEIVYMGADFGIILDNGTTILRYGTVWTKRTKLGKAWRSYPNAAALFEFNPHLKNKLPILYSLYV